MLQLCKLLLHLHTIAAGLARPSGSILRSSSSPALPSLKDGAYPITSSSSPQLPPSPQDDERSNPYNEQLWKEKKGTAMLEHTTDNYDGVTVTASLPPTTEAFKEVMEASLETWRSTGKKGVWLKVNSCKA